LVVIGLSERGDTSALHSALTAAGLSIDPLQIIGPSDSDEPASDHGLAGTEIITGDPGTAVPGINSPGGAPRVFFRNEAMEDRLGDLEIPDGEVENFLEALERGHTVVAYFAKHDGADQVDQLFRGAGLTNVRRYGV